jgi:poly[(R)-3-hydroxyalkanoate] polymerase subunit PhaC
MASIEPTRPTVDESIAEYRDGIALTSALALDRRAMLESLQLVVDRATEQPRAAFEVAGGLLRELFGIAVGSSTIEPAPKDSRFKDDAWRDNPLYRRLGQAYLAWGRSLDTWLGRSNFDALDRERARFMLDIVKDLAAPMNTLPGNPEALRKAWQTRGESLLRGLRNFLDDQRHNHGYPAVADRNAFEIGVDVAASPGAVVYRNELLEVIQYRPNTPSVHPIPLVYVFSQVNRFYLGDLTPDRSLFQQLLDVGVQVFAVSWRNPTEAQRSWGLDTYAEGVIQAVAVAREVSRSGRVNLIGVCAGGLTTAVAAGVLAARGDDWLASLSLFINILDNRPGDADFGLFVSERSVATQKARVRSEGIFDEKNVFEMFAWLRPEENVMTFFRSNYLLGEDPIKHPLLFWSMDYTRLPAGLYSDFLDLSYANKLAKAETRALGNRIDLKNVTCDVYMMAGSTDHITPWVGCYRSTQLFGGNIEFVLTNQNHTQTISARTDNRHLKYWIADTLPPTADGWMRVARECPGDWRRHWFDWLTQRSGNRVPAPTAFGSNTYPQLDPAPGRYVVEQ